MKNIWFNIQQHIQSWFTQSPSSESEEELVEIPDILKAELLQKINESPSPEAYQTTVREAIETAVDSWQQHQDAANYVVFLASSVESVAKIIDDSLADWNYSSIEIITPFKCFQRPQTTHSMTKQIFKALEPYPQIKTDNLDQQSSQNTEDLKKIRKTLVVVPSLEQFFLRCIGGWDSIECFREIIVKNSNCFWVIGSSVSSWNFLDFVCQISAYFETIHPLPELDAEMIARWLTSIAESLVQLDEPDYSSNDLRQAYWDLIANQASGSVRVAQYLWLESLRIHKTTLEDKEGTKKQTPREVSLLASETRDKRHDSQTKANPEELLLIHPVKPSLPSLPSLTNVDRYLLHAILIHRMIDRSHLAQALGESKSQIQARVQWLSRQGVLENKQGILSIHPLYYAKLKVDLSNNNFFISAS